MKKKIIGRVAEQAALITALESPDPELVAVIGRRRVGKTFLIKNTYADRLAFEATGLQTAPLSEQLQNFAFRINKTFYGGTAKLKPKNWLDAFQILILALEQQQYNEKMVVFLDELPWLDSRKSGFLRALGFFWNSWCVDHEIILVICGSAASWIIEHVVNDGGGLHNRITKKVELQAFSLLETEHYLKNRNIRLDRYQIVQLYMALGGIPHYLNEVKPGKSAVENIGNILFSTSSTLHNEFQNLYPALFDNAIAHSTVVRALAQKWKGLSRKEIVQITGLPDGGQTTGVLDELLYSGFITQYYPYGKIKRERLYRLSDEYSLFYICFIENNTTLNSEWWQTFSQTASFKSWSGYAFESICLKHVSSIKKALGISGIYTEASTYYLKSSAFGRGIQIDLLLERNDQAINLFEIKFYQSPFVVNKEDADDFRLKSSIFKTETNTKKQIFFTLLTTFPLTPNEYSLGTVDVALDLNCLFD